VSAAPSVLELVSAPRGHFELESGYHGQLWLDLDTLFADASRIAPLAQSLGALLAPHNVDVVCGPLLGGAFLAQLVAPHVGAEFMFAEKAGRDEAGLFAARYRIPDALARRVAGRRVAIVDDVMSAGSSVRATHVALEALGAKTVVVGALLVLGTAGESFFGGQGVAVETLAREDYALWTPADCPMCLAGAPLERMRG
jgi:orotate phosphoribosyltransferase